MKAGHWLARCHGESTMCRWCLVLDTSCCITPPAALSAAVYERPALRMEHAVPCIASHMMPGLREQLPSSMALSLHPCWSTCPSVLVF
jgi:hypothetical protein